MMNELGSIFLRTKGSEWGPKEQGQSKVRPMTTTDLLTPAKESNVL